MKAGPKMAEEEKVNREKDRLDKLLSGEDDNFEKAAEKADKATDKAVEKAAAVLEKEKKELSSEKRPSTKQEKILKKSPHAGSKQKKDKSLLLATIALVLVILFVVGTLVGSLIVNSGILERSKVSVKTEHFSVTNPMLAVMTRNMYNSYVQQYGEYISYMGLDTGKKLSEQTNTETNEDGTNKTWLETLRASAVENAKQILVWCEAAREAGFSLTDKNKEEIDEVINQFKTYAQQNGMDLKTYLTNFYGETVAEGDLRKVLEYSYIAQYFQMDCQDKLTYSEEDLNAYADEHNKEITEADYYSYAFSSTLAEDATDDEKNEEKEANKAAADALAANTDLESFEAALKVTVTEKATKEVADEEATAAEKANTEETASAETTEEKTTEEKITEKVDSAMTSAKSSGSAYTEGNAVSEWVFGDGRKDNETTVLDDGNGTYTVVYLIKAPHRDDSNTKNVRHILLTTSTYGSEEAADEKAQAILDEFNAGDKTEESFAALADEYTEDQGSASKGGLYENVEKGKMVAAFNDWLFDESRKPGDTGTVKSDYGVHVMYFVGEGLPVWMAKAEGLKKAEDFQKISTDNTEKYTVETQDDNIAIVGNNM